MRLSKSGVQITLSAQEDYTLQGIGASMDLTKEWVRQIEMKALITLRKKLLLKDLQNINQIL